MAEALSRSRAEARFDPYLLAQNPPAEAGGKEEHAEAR